MEVKTQSHEHIQSLEELLSRFDAISNTVKQISEYEKVTQTMEEVEAEVDLI